LEYDFLCLQIKLAAFMCNFNFFGKNRTEPELTEGITKKSVLFEKFSQNTFPMKNFQLSIDS